MLDLAVVVSTYQERENVTDLIQRLDTALVGLFWELIFVDDDSPDDTAELLRELAERDCRVRLGHRIGWRAVFGVHQGRHRRAVWL